MSREVEWSVIALRDLHGMHWKAAAAVDAAIQLFAERGEGSLKAVTVGDRRELRLYVAPYFAWITVTPESVIVWRVLRYV